MAGVSIDWVTDDNPLVGKNKEYLRGSVSVVISEDTLGELATLVKGCLAFRKPGGDLTVKGPSNKSQYGKRTQPIQVGEFSPDLVKLLVGQIEESEWGALIPSPTVNKAIWSDPIEVPL